MLIHICVCAYIFHGMPVDVRNNLLQSVLSYTVGPGDQTQVSGLADLLTEPSHQQSLSAFSSLSRVFLGIIYLFVFVYYFKYLIFFSFLCQKVAQKDPILPSL